MILIICDFAILQYLFIKKNPRSRIEVSLKLKGFNKLNEVLLFFPFLFPKKKKLDKFI